MCLHIYTPLYKALLYINPLPLWWGFLLSGELRWASVRSRGGVPIRIIGNKKDLLSMRVGLSIYSIGNCSCICFVPSGV